MLGVILISLESHPDNQCDGLTRTASADSDTTTYAVYMVGVLAVTLDSLLSGLSLIHISEPTRPY